MQAQADTKLCQKRKPDNETFQVEIPYTKGEVPKIAINAKA